MANPRQHLHLNRLFPLQLQRADPDLLILPRQCPLELLLVQKRALHSCWSWKTRHPQIHLVSILLGRMSLLELRFENFLPMKFSVRR